MISLALADPQRRELLRSLVLDYIAEFDGSADYPYLDRYWSEENRLPFLIEGEGGVVGFCLVRVRNGGWEIAEFSVLPELRRGGIGRQAIDALAGRARGGGAAFLQAKVHPNNPKALPFWLACGFHEIESPGVVVTRRVLTSP